MHQTILQNVNTSVQLGGYDFPHSGGPTDDGFIVRADTQEHLDIIVNDVQNDSVPSVIPSVSETDIIMSELMMRVIELEMVNVTLIEELMSLKGV